SLRDRAGNEIAAGAGAGEQLYQAVRAAMAPLLDRGAIPRASASAIDPEIARWSGIADVSLALLLEDWQLSLLLPKIAREALDARRGRLGPILATLAVTPASSRSGTRPPRAIPPRRPSTPGAVLPAARPV